MPTYRAPGVYVEDVAFAAHAIQPQPTNLTAFVGMTAWGSVTADPPLLTSLSDYQRFYGPSTDLRLGNEAVVNHIAHAVRAFFQNGGQRLHVVRITGTNAKAARWAAADGAIALTARAPGGLMLESGDGNFRASFKIVRRSTTNAKALRLPIGTLIEVDGASVVIDQGTTPAMLAALADDAVVTCVSLSITIEAPGGIVESYDDLAFDPRHPRAVQTMFEEGSPSGECLLRFEVAETMSPAGLRDALETAGSALLTGGSDGDGPPSIEDWTGAMERLRAIDDVSIIAAPGCSVFPGETPKAVAHLLITLAEQPAHGRFAVIDPPPELQPNDVTAFAASFDSRHAAIYYPWVVISDPTGRGTLTLPQSGFLCGIYARSDIERGVSKDPANEVVRLALGFAQAVNRAQQEILNPKGINCLRFFEGRGKRVWGARTLSSDAEWKFVSLRRYIDYLERSIDRGIAWAVFEPNGERLWATLAQKVTDFLMRQWRTGGLLGSKAEEAFFVNCDRTTMPQTDIDNGRIVILIGVAPLRPAEFIIFRMSVATQTPDA